MNGTINERVARCRKLANLTQTEAAEKLGMKCSTYSQMERKGNISSERLIALAEAFNVTTDILLYGTSPAEEFARTQMIVEEKPKPMLRQEPSFMNNFHYNEAPFSVSRKEEKIVKIMRNLSKPKRDELYSIIEQAYKENK